MPMAALLLCARMGVARALVDNLLELRSWTDAERLIAPLHASRRRSCRTRPMK